MRAASAAGLSFLLASSLALAEDQRTFTQWDTNSDGQITQQEFIRGIKNAGWMNQWDTNDDNRIGPAEFSAVNFGSNFDQWDTNGNGYLSPRELYSGIYAAYDVDGDGQWTLGEWNDARDENWFAF